ncbi:MAG TPA: AbrB/MazE/SpoVT family DNA-binding domain-containing protein [Gammaproteobacteria bacterium]|nr:AbrB/MazE/SpoVT family DNA-binding domain-containing protein [Gammaproteobacteria bacterium]
MSDSIRHVRLFRNGRNQALRIPREFEFQGDEALLHKEDDRLIVEPICTGHLLELLDTLEPIEDDFPDVDVVTANVQAFSRVPSLAVENWLAS